jgi:hypothetical protein
MSASVKAGYIDRQGFNHMEGINHHNTKSLSINI